MKLSYKVTEEDYKKIIEYTLKERANMLYSRIFFLLSTVGILILAGILIYTYPFTMFQNATLFGAALLAAGANYFSRRAYHQKAANLFTQMMKRGTIQANFWNAHSLEPKEDGLLMIYGDTEYLLPWHNLTAPELDEDFLYIKNVQKSVVEGVPRCAVSENHLKQLKELIEHYQKPNVSV